VIRGEEASRLKLLVVSVALLLFMAGDAMASWSMHIGDSCLSIGVKEFESGATFKNIQEGRENVSFLASFERAILGRASTVSYVCGEGYVASHGAVIPVDSESQGRIVFSELQEIVIAELGPAEVDADENDVSALSEFIETPVRRAMEWVTDSGYVDLSLSIGARGEWEVEVHASGLEAQKDQILDWMGTPNHRAMVSTDPECPERWLYKVNVPGEENLPDAYSVAFSPDGQVCMLNPMTKATTVVHPAWSMEPLSVTYPMEARIEEIEGSATLEFTVTQDGAVRKMSVIESSDPRFASAVIEGFRDLKVNIEAFESEEFPYTQMVRVPFVFAEEN
jgi:TonB family protein